jgi:arginine repressor
MGVTAKTLFEAKYAESSQTSQYTSTGVRCIIDKLTGYNGTAGAVTLAVNLVASAGAAGASNLIVLKTISAGETYTFPEIVGHVLNAGDFISTIAGAATSIVIRASGREIAT